MWERARASQARRPGPVRSTASQRRNSDTLPWNRNACRDRVAVPSRLAMVQPSSCVDVLSLRPTACARPALNMLVRRSGAVVGERRDFFVHLHVHLSRAGGRPVRICASLALDVAGVLTTRGTRGSAWLRTTTGCRDEADRYAWMEVPPPKAQSATAERVLGLTFARTVG